MEQNRQPRNPENWKVLKTPGDSYTVMTEIVLSSHANGTGRLFGGQLMSWMDIAGAICARRHCCHEVVTARADCLTFHRPARQNDMIIISAKLLWVGNTSMKIRIQAEVEPMGTDGRELICSAYFVYVAIDTDGVKCIVPRLTPADDTDRAEMAQCREES